VNPCEDCGEISRCERGTEKALKDHDNGKKKRGDLQSGASMTPAEKTSNYWDAEEVELGPFKRRDNRVGGWSAQRSQIV
jgi:hypothetical protein